MKNTKNRLMKVSTLMTPIENNKYDKSGKTHFRMVNTNADGTLRKESKSSSPVSFGKEKYGEKLS